LPYFPGRRLGLRLLHTVGVTGSNPVSPTISQNADKSLLILRRAGWIISIIESGSVLGKRRRQLPPDFQGGTGGLIPIIIELEASSSIFADGSPLLGRGVGGDKTTK